jgi:hypothetical protein
MNAAPKTMRASLVEVLEDLHARIAETILKLDEPACYWHPAPGLPSIADLVAQAAAEERRWIIEAVSELHPPGNIASSQQPAAEPGEHPLFLLGNTGQISQIVLAALLPADWTAPCQVDGQRTTAAGCVLHILEELARTLGKIEVIEHLIVEAIREGGDDQARAAGGNFRR